ncbi:unnamed protein product [Ectocarpus sp. 8 AP-2014]
MGGTNSETARRSPHRKIGPKSFFMMLVATQKRGELAEKAQLAVGVPMITLASDEVCVTLTFTSVMQRCCVLESHNLNLIAIIAQHTHPSMSPSLRLSCTYLPYTPARQPRHTIPRGNVRTPRTPDFVS